MSEVKRYHVTENGLVEGQALGRLNVVLSADFDRVTAELKSAKSDKEAYAQNAIDLRKRVDALQQRLTAAGEREATAIAFITRLIECAGGQPSVATGYLRDILDALKPTEPAKDERVCTGCGSRGWTANCKECVPY